MKKIIIYLLFICVFSVKNIFGMHTVNNFIEKQKKIYQKKAVEVLMFHIKKNSNLMENRIPLVEVINCGEDRVKIFKKYNFLNCIAKELDIIVSYLKSHKINDHTIIQYITIKNNEIKGIFSEFAVKE